MHFNPNHDGNKVEIEARLLIDDSLNWNLVNGQERILIAKGMGYPDSFSFKLPLYNTWLSGAFRANLIKGVWTDSSRKNYTIPFEGRAEKFSESAISNHQTYHVNFTTWDQNESYDAIGSIAVQDTEAEGTFMTETGDFRYLQGTMQNNLLKLSCFDGTHLFGLSAMKKGDSLVEGVFYSGSHSRERWSGVLDEGASLSDPDSLTSLIDQADFTFTARNLHGDSIQFDKNRFKDKVTLIQVMGTWCPNCTDESFLLNSFYKKYHQQGLEIIPVVFERTDNIDHAARQITEQFKQMHLPYEPYFGGATGNRQADKVFHQVNHIMSFPTLIILDKKGQVRKIHTGFYGPSTGKKYLTYSDNLERFIRILLSEE